MKLDNDLGAFLQANTKPEDVVVCDAPWISLWQGNRTSIWLPNDIQTLKALQRKVKVDWLFVTFQYWREMDPWKQWIRNLAAAKGQPYDGFVFEKAFTWQDRAAYLFRPVPMEESKTGDPSPAALDFR